MRTKAISPSHATRTRPTDPTTPLCLAVLWVVAVLSWFAGAAPVAAAAPASHTETLFFDAVFTHARTAGPGPGHVGHRQIADGILRDASGRSSGTFAFTCTWTRVEPDGASERCRASAFTSDGRLDAAGPSHSSSVVHSWRLIGGSGVYRDASGRLSVRDLGEREALLTATVTAPDSGQLHAGKVGRPRADQPFIARADDLCRRAGTALASLPAFPFATFDPLHPDPSVLPQVGAFFTGPGDPRPILRTLDAGLRDLGQPRRERQVWRLARRARDRELAVIDKQDRAALVANVPVFVQSVHESAANFRQIAITETVFGSTPCVL